MNRYLPLSVLCSFFRSRGKKKYLPFNQSFIPPLPCLGTLMIPQTVPSGTSFPLLPQPAPVGSPLQALGLGQEVRLVSISSLGNFNLTHLVFKFTHLSTSDYSGADIWLTPFPCKRFGTKSTVSRTGPSIKAMLVSLDILQKSPASPKHFLLAIRPQISHYSHFLLQGKLTAQKYLSVIVIRLGRY